MTMPNLRVFIVAGNHDEYEDWLHQNKCEPRQRYIYVSGPDVFQGFANIVVKYVGSYYSREDIEHIKIALTELQVIYE